jgi:hypothetical protein
MQFKDLHGATKTTTLKLLELQGWNYFFIIGGILAFFSLRFLNR